MDFYRVLGLRPDATAEQIRRAYRRLARKFHPNLNPGDRVAAEQFQIILEAFETLHDPARRRVYDERGAVAGVPGRASIAGAAATFEGFDFSVTVEGQHASTFGDLFADVIKGPAIESTHPEHGSDLHCVLTLTFDEARQGVTKSVTLTRLVQCHTCHGFGRMRIAEGRCPACRGTGHVKNVRGHMVFSRTCAACGGSGDMQFRPCTTCHGGGVTVHSEVVSVDVPPGTADGARILIRHMGNAGRRGGRPGDLLVTVSVEAHPLFERRGDDLHLDVPVALHEAALGAKITIPTLDGPTMLRIPPGTQSGDKLRLRERGIPTANRKGDLIVTVRLVMPRLSDERSKELMRELARLNPDNVRKDLGV